MISKNVCKYILLFVFCFSVVRVYAFTPTVTRGELAVVGKCSKYFDESGRQIKQFPSRISCVVKVKTNFGGEPEPNVQFNLMSLYSYRDSIDSEWTTLAQSITNSRGQKRLKIQLNRRRALLRLIADPLVLNPDPLKGHSCVELKDSVNRELELIQACTQDSACGQPLLGTSCGCTRDQVARSGADSKAFYEALNALFASSECDSGMITTCDCPQVNGFRCVSGRCAWNYSNSVID